MRMRRESAAACQRRRTPSKRLTTEWPVALTSSGGLQACCTGVAQRNCSLAAYKPLIKLVRKRVEIVGKTRWRDRFLAGGLGTVLGLELGYHIDRSPPNDAVSLVPLTHDGWETVMAGSDTRLPPTVNITLVP